MRRLLALFFISTLCFSVSAQKRNRKTTYGPPTPRQMLEGELASECSFSNKYTKSERLRFYPFNKAKSIEIIAFKEGESIPINHKIIDERKVLEKITLNAKQIDSLTSIIYNIGFTPIKNAIRFVSDYKCYEPRNGIVFLDEQGKAFEYLEICFTCEHSESSSKRFNYDEEPCTTKYELLKNFFKWVGIKYGTNEREPILPYKEIFKMDTSEVSDAIRNKLLDKTMNSSSLGNLNKTEQILLLASNCEIIGDSRGVSGIAEFYFTNRANFYDQIVEALNIIGASKTLKVLELSKRQWPDQKIPTNLVERRKLLLELIDNADPKWTKLEGDLENSKEEEGLTFTSRIDNLNNLILKFSLAHRDDLKD